MRARALVCVCAFLSTDYDPGRTLLPPDIYVYTRAARNSSLSTMTAPATSSGPATAQTRSPSLDFPPSCAFFSPPVPPGRDEREREREKMAEPSTNGRSRSSITRLRGNKEASCGFDSVLFFLFSFFFRCRWVWDD